MKNKSLTELFLKYDSRDVARKMLKDLASATPKEIGEAVLSTRLPRQKVKFAISFKGVS